jgi:CheY-like chemotaxis protein
MCVPYLFHKTNPLSAAPPDRTTRNAARGGDRPGHDPSDARLREALHEKDHPDAPRRPVAGPDSPRHPEPDRATAPARPRERRSVLVVDDNETVTKALRIHLSEAGYDVTALESGMEALKRAQGARFDAAVIDVHLNDINGLVLTQRLRDLYGNAVPIIVLSGDTSMETINSLPLVGATYFIPKPVQSAKLIEQLRQWVV